MKDLRDFITLVEDAWSADGIVAEPELEIVEEAGINVAEHLADLVFKLRAHSEPLSESLEGDYSLGVEAGMDMAADMIENLIRQLSGSNEQ